jgi:16S rRNA (cytosine1402-N4)-methyltransferase
MNKFSHQPVLVDKVIKCLNLKGNSVLVDATIGLGGHSLAILNSCLDCKIIGIDRDKQALNIASKKLISFKNRVVLKPGNFTELKSLVNQKVDGILFDLGISSMQLDKRERGFSFDKKAKLDMRMNNESKLTAEKIVNSYSANHLTKIIGEYGEERWAKRIAENIVKARKDQKIETTTELAEIVRSTIPKKNWPKKIDPATKTFQAIRIEVNDELNNLKIGLDKALEILKPKGRIVVISFHSLEDRIVKNKFKYWAKDCICPPDYPICKCNKQKQVKILTQRPIRADRKELENNPRAKSAKLRVAEKL